MTPAPLDVLTIALEWRSQSVEAVLLGLCRVLRTRGLPEGGYRYKGRTVELAAAIPAVKNGRAPAFSFDGDHGRGFHFISFPDGYDQITIKWPRFSEVPWDEWISPFVGASFLLGWVADSDYHYWQNLRDPDTYVRGGRSLDGLTLIQDTLPGRQVIDISKNPGYVVRRPGKYPQAVGAVMWLGERFWKLSGVDRSSVEEADWLQVQESRSGVLRLQAARHPFTTAGDESGDLQRRLRRLLFPASGVK